ncbi:hypothetical protein [Pyxidicoccus xibeiensis]|uniref:hypothetical protein n=1 Tax=Pyxidicoccus xibeiensis TaxID=2906759 RepID=UPI0020A7C242|nr:hypothetical protein [Pyxidicoccus xibeiensis]MCP3142774.1 hypothetical protein [Pyxidicoccus xibeiensis]
MPLYECSLYAGEVYFSRSIMADGPKHAATLFRFDVAGGKLPEGDIMVRDKKGNRHRFTWSLEQVEK